MSRSQSHFFFALVTTMLLGMSASGQGKTSNTGDPDNRGANAFNICSPSPQGAVNLAKDDCSSWAQEQYDARNCDGGKPKDSKYKDDLKCADLKRLSNCGESMNDTDLTLCRKSYGLTGTCSHIPTKDADNGDDDDDDDDGTKTPKVYNSADTSPANSDACKAIYAKKYQADKKSDYDILDKAETKSNDAQKNMMESAMKEQEQESNLAEQIQKIQPKLDNDLLQLRTNLTKEQQKDRDDINDILLQENNSKATIQSIEQQGKNMKDAYVKAVNNLLRDCKQKIQDTAFQTGQPVQYRDSAEQTTAANEGGLGNHKCIRDTKYNEALTSLQNDYQNKITQLINQEQTERNRIANLLNKVTLEEKNMDEDTKLGTQQAAQMTKAASDQTQILNQRLAQMRNSAMQQSNMLQAQAKLASSEFTDAKAQYDADKKSAQSLASYAGKSSDDDDAKGADPTLTEISDGVKSLPNLTLCNNLDPAHPYKAPIPPVACSSTDANGGGVVGAGSTGTGRNGKRIPAGSTGTGTGTGNNNNTTPPAGAPSQID